MDISTLHPLEKKFLRILKPNQKINAELISQTGLMTPEHIRGVIGWLKARDWLEEISSSSTEIAELTELGKQYVEQGLPLRRVWNYFSSFKPISGIQTETGLSQSESGKAFGFLKKQSLIEIQGDDAKIKENIDPEIIHLNTLENLVDKASQNDLSLEDLTQTEQSLVRDNAKKRGTGEIFKLKQHLFKTYQLNSQGESVRTAVSTQDEELDEIGQITPQLLKEKKWENKNFRKYNINLAPKPVLSGRLHPYGRFLDLVRSKLTSMGFMEMRGPVVESEFYNSDLLYMPQYHPARDIHDIYLVKDPSKAHQLPKEILNNVAQAHRDGGRSGSKGWGYDFDVDKTQQLILRSQGTAISARTLASKPQIPGKYFAIARCFRYDQVDATHAPDFFQIEGIIIEEKINFCHLLGLLSTFAKKLAGAKNIKFVPGYFPFTEPSVEAHIEHPDLGWIELGGAGIFRPEITESVNILCPVIAWGLGLDRMAMNALKINDIRELFTIDLEKIRSSKVVI
jgi:phenylalanyl-tRNA synthetase alpha chain